MNASLPHIDFLDIPIHVATMEQALACIESGVVVTPNIDHLARLRRDEEFRACYREADWVLCDSRIIRMLSLALPESLPEAVPGSTFFTRFYEHHASDPDCRIFLLGARPGVAEEARRRINARIGREIVVGAHSPSFGFEKNQDEAKEIAAIINRSGATVVLVGVGAPKQEKWIREHKAEMPGVKLWLALGATIDFEAGAVKRAPRWVQRICMEWFYRFLCEPRRMFRRYFINDPVVLFDFLRHLPASRRKGKSNH